MINNIVTSNNYNNIQIIADNETIKVLELIKEGLEAIKTELIHFESPIDVVDIDITAIEIVCDYLGLRQSTIETYAEDISLCTKGREGVFASKIEFLNNLIAELKKSCETCLATRQEILRKKLGAERILQPITTESYIEYLTNRASRPSKKCVALQAFADKETRNAIETIKKEILKIVESLIPYEESLSNLEEEWERVINYIKDACVHFKALQSSMAEITKSLLVYTNSHQSEFSADIEFINTSIAELNKACETRWALSQEILLAYGIANHAISEANLPRNHIESQITANNIESAIKVIKENLLQSNIVLSIYGNVEEVGVEFVSSLESQCNRLKKMQSNVKSIAESLSGCTQGRESAFALDLEPTNNLITELNNTCDSYLKRCLALAPTKL